MNNSVAQGNAPAVRTRPPRRMLVGFGIILLLLASLPVIAIATGSLNGTPQYTLMAEVPERGDGGYLQVEDGTRRGVVQLYAWNFALNEFPPDAPAFNPAHIKGLIISQRGIDDPARYQLFNLDSDTPVPMNVEPQVTKLYYTPQAPLADGRYMVDMPKSGMSSDRQYLYFRIDSNVPTLPAK